MSTKTFDFFLQQDNATEKCISEVRTLIRERILKCIEDPDKFTNDPITKIMAEWEYENQASHQCYWNNRFVIAIMCKMPLWQIKMATWCLVSNGINRYFEWKTHSGYDMKTVFKYLGLDTPTFISYGMYHYLDSPICEKLVTMFNLPTNKFGRIEPLTDRETTEREFFNRKYPHTIVL